MLYVQFSEKKNIQIGKNRVSLEKRICPNLLYFFLGNLDFLGEFGPHKKKRSKLETVFNVLEKAFFFTKGGF